MDSEHIILSRISSFLEESLECEIAEEWWHNDDEHEELMLTATRPCGRDHHNDEVMVNEHHSALHVEKACEIPIKIRVVGNTLEFGRLISWCGNGPMPSHFQEYIEWDFNLRLMTSTPEVKKAIATHYGICNHCG